MTPEQGAEWAQNRGLIFLGIWPSVKSIYEAMRRMGPKYGTDLPRWSLELEPLKLHTLCEVRGEGVSKKVFLLVAPLALSMSSVKSIYINFGFLCVCLSVDLFPPKGKVLLLCFFPPQRVKIESQFIVHD